MKITDTLLPSLDSDSDWWEWREDRSSTPLLRSTTLF